MKVYLLSNLMVVSNQPENVIPKSSSSLNSSLCSDATVQTLRRLHECNALRPDITYQCKARVTKLRSKPRIKNDNWLMSVDISDEEASLEVAFHGSVSVILVIRINFVWFLTVYIS